MASPTSRRSFLANAGQCSPGDLYWAVCSSSRSRCTRHFCRAAQTTPLYAPQKSEISVPSNSRIKNFARAGLPRERSISPAYRCSALDAPPCLGGSLCFTAPRCDWALAASGIRNYGFLPTCLFSAGVQCPWQPTAIARSSFSDPTPQHTQESFPSTYAQPAHAPSALRANAPSFVMLPPTCLPLVSWLSTLDSLFRFLGPTLCGGCGPLVAKGDPLRYAIHGYASGWHPCQRGHHGGGVHAAAFFSLQTVRAQKSGPLLQTACARYTSRRSCTAATFTAFAKYVVARRGGRDALRCPDGHDSATSTRARSCLRRPARFAGGESGDGWLRRRAREKNETAHAAKKRRFSLTASL